MEVERKFIVAQAPSLDEAPSQQIEQGYLAAGFEGEVRLRRKGEDRLLTVKRGSGLSRSEEEIELSVAQFDALWPLTEGRRVSKRRYVLPQGEREIELDVYEGDLEGLVVAEVEFGGEEEARAFEPPAWFADEVTGNPAYLNESLAVAGVPS